MTVTILCLRSFSSILDAYCDGATTLGQPTTTACDFQDLHLYYTNGEDCHPPGGNAFTQIIALLASTVGRSFLRNTH